MSERIEIPETVAKRNLAQAAQYRMAGLYAEARSIGNSYINDSSVSIRISAAQITVSSLLDAVRQSESSSKAITHLENARHIIVMNYRDSLLRTRARKIKTDLLGTPRDTIKEMAYQEAQYLMLAGAVSGNPQFIQDAIRRLDYVISTTKDENLRATTIFTRERVINTSASEASFSNAINHAEQAHDWERVAEVSARYMLDAQQSEAAKEVYTRALANNTTLNGVLEREIKFDQNQRNWSINPARPVELSLPNLRGASARHQ